MQAHLIKLIANKAFNKDRQPLIVKLEMSILIKP